MIADPHGWIQIGVENFVELQMTWRLLLCPVAERSWAYKSRITTYMSDIEWLVVTLGLLLADMYQVYKCPPELEELDDRKEMTTITQCSATKFIVPSLG